jgi:hypothetical protein
LIAKKCGMVIATFAILWPVLAADDEGPPVRQPICRARKFVGMAVSSSPTRLTEEL